METGNININNILIYIKQYLLFRKRNGTLRYLFHREIVSDLGK